jgi:hypothetical protein
VGEFVCQENNIGCRCSKNRVLKKIFGPKWKEVTGDWRKRALKSDMVLTLHHILFQ